MSATRMAVVLAVTIFVWPASTFLETRQHPDLAGAWKLNPGLTAQAAQRSVGDRAAIAGRRAPLGGGPVGMGGGGHGPADTFGGGARRSNDDDAKAREANRMTVIDPAGVTQRWTLDGRTSTSEVGALTIETKAKWTADALVVERKFEGGVKVTDRYSVSGNPRQLLVASKIQMKNGPGDRTMQRIYDLELVTKKNP